MGKGRTWNSDATLRMPQGSQLRLATEKSHVGLKCLGSSIISVHVLSHWLGAVQEECGPGLNSPVAPKATPNNQCRFFPWGKNDHPCCYMAWYTKQNKWHDASRGDIWQLKHYYFLIKIQKQQKYSLELNDMIFFTYVFLLLKCSWCTISY